MLSRKRNEHEEEDRLAELKAYGLLDTPNEPAFDAIVRKAASTFGTPIALISLIDEERQWFKARHGLAPAETPQSNILLHARHSQFGGDGGRGRDQGRTLRCEPVGNWRSEHPLLRGAPLKTVSGRRIGTLCVIGREARGDFSETSQQRLQKWRKRS
jgi:GAF domain-containing protein